MVAPIHLISIALLAAFSLGLFKNSQKISTSITLIAMAVLTLISGQWTFAILNGLADMPIYTAGFKPPFSINLLMGKNEAILTLLVNLSVFLSTLFLISTNKFKNVYPLILLLIFLVGLNGIIMTRDLFNIFVFLELISITSAGLFILNNNVKQLGAGFKYIIAGSIAGAFLLLGIIFTYSTTGSLNIDIISNNISGVLTASGFVGLFLIFIGFIIELKSFPINGWGLDIYEAAPPAIGAILASGVATALFYTFTKVMTMTGSLFVPAATIIGLTTFIASNVLALKQKNSKRLLGYSSIGQVGLMVFAFSALHGLNLDKIQFILFGLLVTHALAKAGLFWLSGIIKRENIKEWSLLRKSPFLLVPFILFVFALIGLPPFPSFFAKWQLIMELASKGSFILIGVLLLGTMLEAVYLFRWLGYVLKLDIIKEKEFSFSYKTLVSPLIASLALLVLGYFTSLLIPEAKGIPVIPLLFIFGISFLDFLPAKIKNSISIIGISIYAYFVYPTFSGDLFKMVFGGIFMGGALLTLLSGYYYKGRRRGFYPAALSMFAGLFMLVQSTNLLQLLFAWELMSIGSYFLLIRGKKSMPHGLSYMLFSMGGSFAMLAGFGLAYASNNSLDISALSNITIYPTLAYSLLLIGFMTKTASIGLHIWLPGAHGEAVADIHFMASAILLKAGVFGMILVLQGMGNSTDYAKQILFVLTWVGALTALIGNVNAAFQESAKRLLAWSSIGQLGYIVFGLATMTHLGWLIALTTSITHFLYKGILFLIVGGIALKLGTPLMYKMGGLIKRMPFSFFAVLVAIITLSGVPPLVGYVGKWIMYNLTISEGYYFQGVVIAISGLVAFLYLFRLIFSIFLGQLKDEHRHISEISIWFLIPVYLLFGYIMYVSTFPNTLLKPIGSYLMEYFPNNAITWNGSLGSTPFGYFDGTLIMLVFMGLFASIFGILYFLNRRSQKVKQFNIVYAAERPVSPETTHFAYNFFAPYRRAIGFLEYPLTINFWNHISESLHAIAGFVRRIYTGNGQTYILQILIFVVIVFFLTSGSL